MSDPHFSEGGGDAGGDGWTVRGRRGCRSTHLPPAPPLEKDEGRLQIF